MTSRYGLLSYHAQHSPSDSDVEYTTNRWSFNQQRSPNGMTDKTVSYGSEQAGIISSCLNRINATPTISCQYSGLQLHIKAFAAKACLVSFHKIFALFFAVPHNAFVSRLFGLRTRAAHAFLLFTAICWSRGRATYRSSHVSI